MAITIDGKSEFGGRVLSVGCHVDSLWELGDYYAVVLNDAGAVERIATGCRPWMMAAGAYHVDESQIDATAEVIAMAQELRYEACRSRIAADSAAAACEVKKGRRVVVVRGRKVPVGTEGEVIWIGESQYGRRVGVKDAGGLVHWTALGNVEVSNALDYVGEWSDFEAEARRESASSYPEARAALARREADGTGEFFVDPFKKAMIEAIENTPKPLKCLHCDAPVEGNDAVCPPCAEKMLTAETADPWPDGALDEPPDAVTRNLMDALSVLVLDRKVRTFLELYDPKALAQAIAALEGAGRSDNTPEVR